MKKILFYMLVLAGSLSMASCQLGRHYTRRELERSSKATMELAQLQYINGVIGYLDVLDAQRSYFDAQIGLSNAIHDKQITMVKMYKALGGGW